jgi:hypothetical protein
MKDLIDSLTEATWVPRVTHADTLEKFKGLESKTKARVKKILKAIGEPKVMAVYSSRMIIDEASLTLAQLKGVTRLKVRNVGAFDSYAGPRIEIGF